MLRQEIKEKITKKSVSLEKYGFNDLAWNREDAEDLLHGIMKDKIGVLGGDVYDLTSNFLEPLSENWHCEPAEKESEEEYYLRSKSESLKYIKNYPIQPGERILFSMTFTEEVV